MFNITSSSSTLRGLPPSITQHSNLNRSGNGWLEVGFIYCLYLYHSYPFFEKVERTPVWGKWENDISFIIISDLFWAHVIISSSDQQWQWRGGRMHPRRRRLTYCPHLPPRYDLLGQCPEFITEALAGPSRRIVHFIWWDRQSDAAAEVWNRMR